MDPPPVSDSLTADGIEPYAVECVWTRGGGFDLSFILFASLYRRHAALSYTQYNSLLRCIRDSGPTEIPGLSQVEIHTEYMSGVQSNCVE